MSRLFDDASSQYLTVASAPVTAVPLTMACWFRSDDATISQRLLELHNSGVSGDNFSLSAQGATAGDPVAFASTTTAGGGSVANTTTGYSANTWHHACGVTSAVNDRAVYIDGGSKGTNTGSKTPSGINSFNVGRRGGTSPGVYFSGRVAEVGIWNVALSDVEVAALARGIAPPYIQPAALVGYWPVWGLHSPEIDLTPNNRTLTVTGATLADHAPVGLFTRSIGGLFIPDVSHRLALLGVGL